MKRNFTLPGRQGGPIKGKPLPRTAGNGDTPWYIPGLRRRGSVRTKVEVTYDALTYDGDALTYDGLKLTYTEPIS